MNTHFKRPVFIGAHPDDICLFCGGLLSKLNGSKFYCYTFTSLNDERREEWKKAMNFLKPTGCELYRFKGDTLSDHRYEIRKLLEKIKKDVDPDIVFTHSLNSVHQSHLALAEETRRIMRYRSILGYEEARTCIIPKLFVELSEENMADKLHVLSYFKSENWKPFFEDDVLLSRARVYGSVIGSKYAEAFDIVRIITP